MWKFAIKTSACYCYEITACIKLCVMFDLFDGWLCTIDLWLTTENHLVRCETVRLSLMTLLWSCLRTNCDRYVIPYSTIYIQYNTSHGTSYHTVQYNTWYIIPYSTIHHMVHHTIQYNITHGTSYHTIQYITCYIIPYSTIQQCSTIHTLLVECQHTKQESAHVTR